MWPLEPVRDEMERLLDAIGSQVIDFVEGLPDAPASDMPSRAELSERVIQPMLAPPAEDGAELAALLARVRDAAATGVETAGPGHLGWIPGGGVFAAAAADLLAATLNRYVALAEIAPGLAALEESVVRWLSGVCGMPAGAGGILTSGGSLANFSAVVAARHAKLGEAIERGTLYVSAHAHQSVAKAARLAGIRAANVRTVACTPDLRMDPQALVEAIAADRASGARPFLVVGSAGTTDTGAIDPLPDLAAIAAEHGLWFHADAAYGGMFRLTERGRERLAGLDCADSVTLDPHKGLFMPYGTGALIVRDPAVLRAAHSVGGHYLQDLEADTPLPNYAELGVELTRELRGLRLWLPLHLYGVAAFRELLDEKLDLAAHAYASLSEESALDVPWRPQLSIVAFRLRMSPGERAEAANRRLLAEVIASRRVVLSSTSIDGRFTLRLCVLSHRSHADRVQEALELIARAARGAERG